MPAVRTADLVYNHQPDEFLLSLVAQVAEELEPPTEATGVRFTQSARHSRR